MKFSHESQNIRKGAIGTLKIHSPKDTGCIEVTIRTTKTPDGTKGEKIKSCMGWMCPLYSEMHKSIYVCDHDEKQTYFRPMKSQIMISPSKSCKQFRSKNHDKIEIVNDYDRSMQA